jgi:hypothetical protein
MKTRRFACALAVTALSAWPAAARAYSPENTLCGDIYFLTYKTLPGWQVSFEPPSGDSSATVDFDSSGADGKRRRIGFVLDSRRGTPSDKERDPQRLLRLTLDLFTLAGFSGRTSPANVRHPTFPSAAATVSSDAGSVTAVEFVAAAEQGRFASVRVFMTLVGERKPSGERLAELQSVIDGLEFDPKAACAPGGDGEDARVTLTPGESLAPLPAAPAAPDEFSVRRALAGAGILERAFVPIQIRPATVGGARSILIDFAPGKTRAEYTRKFAVAAASTYCAEAERVGSSDSTPTLDFLTDEPDVVRRWSCEKNALGEPLHASVTKLDLRQASWFTH